MLRDLRRCEIGGRVKKGMLACSSCVEFAIIAVAGWARR
jgi:hypothetical protein